MSERWLFAALAVVAVLGSACASTSADATPGGVNGGEELVIGWIADIEGLNPGEMTSNEGLRLTEQMYDTLVRPTVDGTSIEPALATDWDVSEDLSTYTFHLRSGVTFHDGSPMTSADVAFSLEQAQLGSVWGSQFGAIDTIETPDDLTVVVNTDSADGDLVNVLGFAPSAIVPNDYGGKTKEEFYEAPIGTGAFKLHAWMPGDRILLDANTDWWDGSPLVDRVTIRIVGDDNARVLQLRNGELHIIDLLPLTAVETLTGAEAVFADPSARTDFMALNVDVSPTDDPHLREAINLVVDREEIVIGALNGFADPAYTLLPAAFPHVHPIATEPDLDAARAAMAASGYPDGVTLDYMLIAGDQAAITSGEILKGQLAQIGVDLRLHPLDYGAWLDKLVARDYEGAGVFFTGDVPSSGPSMQFYATSNGLFTGSAMAETAAARAHYVSEVEDPALNAAVAEFEDAIRSAGAAIPLYHPQTAYGVSNDVTGFAVSPFQQYRLADVGLSG